MCLKIGGRTRRLPIAPSISFRGMFRRADLKASFELASPEIPFDGDLSIGYTSRLL